MIGQAIRLGLGMVRARWGRDHHSWIRASGTTAGIGGVTQTPIGGELCFDRRSGHTRDPLPFRERATGAAGHVRLDLCEPVSCHITRGWGGKRDCRGAVSRRAAGLLLRSASFPPPRDVLIRHSVRSPGARVSFLDLSPEVA